jgi:hypothetical protein
MRGRRAVLAVLIGFGSAGIVGASAATLGGLTGTSLGADAAVVAGCDTTDGVSVSYSTAYQAGSQAYVVTGVTLGNVDAACNGLAGSLTLSGAGGSSLSTQAFTATTGSVAVTLTTPAAASAVTGVAVVISG